MRITIKIFTLNHYSFFQDVHHVVSSTALQYVQMDLMDMNMVMMVVKSANAKKVTYNVKNNTTNFVLFTDCWEGQCMWREEVG